MDIRVFEESGIGALCSLPGKKNAAQYLEVDEKGVIAIPDGIKPPGFHLVVAVPETMNVVVAQRDTETKKGFYHQYFVRDLGEGTWSITKDIPVTWVEQDAWTPWKKVQPNRIDCWIVKDGGDIDLFQVGIVTHDSGKTFRLLGEYRWRGRLFDHQGKIVGKPEDPKWGSFDIRREILDFPEFRRALTLQKTTLSVWKGNDEELNPPLDKVPAEEGHARVKWYTPFMGQTGQGPVVLSDGSTAWVHGADILDPPDPDGVQRLQRNDLLHFVGTGSFGTEENRPPKILCVQKV